MVFDDSLGVFDTRMSSSSVFADEIMRTNKRIDEGDERVVRAITDHGLELEGLHADVELLRTSLCLGVILVCALILAVLALVIVVVV